MTPGALACWAEVIEANQGWDDETPDYGSCPYFMRGLPGADPEGICSFGCWDEPVCMTGHDSEGWPGWDQYTIQLTELLSRAGRLIPTGRAPDEDVEILTERLQWRLDVAATNRSGRKL